MSTMEIALLIIGVIIFVLSFLIPDKGQNQTNKEIDPQEIRRAMETELNGMKLRVNEATNETVEYAMERAERSLERVSNEKIMALSEYSDTIMQGIDKSHQEVLFMYDMLSDKQTDLKNTVRKAEAAAREVEAAPMIQQPVQQTQPIQQVQPTQPVQQMQPIQNVQPVTANAQTSFQELSYSEYNPQEHVIQNQEEVASSGGNNNNDKILMMNKQGHSTVEIAKELGLGVGEVKLVIDLFKD